MELEQYKAEVDELLGRLDNIYSFYKLKLRIYQDVVEMENLMVTRDEVGEMASDFLIATRLDSENLNYGFDKITMNNEYVRDILYRLSDITTEVMDLWTNERNGDAVDYADELLGIRDKWEKRFKKLSIK